jgi:hypothetical protein
VRLEVSPHKIHFGKVVFGNDAESKPHKVTIKNKSETTAVTFSNIGVSGDFTIENRCGAAVEPDGKCDVTLRFKPTGLGKSDGTLTIDSNASNSPASVELTGDGVPPKRVRQLRGSGEDTRTPK